MSITELEFQEKTALSRETAREWLQSQKAKRYLKGEFPPVQENEIFIVRASSSGQGNTFFIKEVKSEAYFKVFKSKDFKSKEFYLLKK